MKGKVKRFLKENMWAILAIAGVITMTILAIKAIEGAEKVIQFYVTMQNLAG